jgi:hypothetical protein
MNRHRRRAAEARARRRQTGYAHRLMAARASGLMPRPGVHFVNIAHDNWCAIYRGGACSCVPDIAITSHGTSGVVLVDERGNCRKVAKQ